MAALALLLAPRPWFVQNTVSSQRGKRKEVVLTGLVEFQKAQCYFAVAVQTAALVYTHQFQSSGAQFRTGIGTNQRPDRRTISFHHCNQRVHTSGVLFGVYIMAWSFDLVHYRSFT